MIQEALRGLLLTDKTLATLLGDRILPSPAPFATPYPLVEYQVVSGADKLTLLKPIGLPNIRIQYDVYGLRAEDVNVIADHLWTFLDGFQGAAPDGTVIQGAHLVLERDSPQKPTVNNPQTLYRIMQDYSVWYERE